MFLPVDEIQVAEAERALKRSFPPDLKRAWAAMGSGFIVRSDDGLFESDNVNRLCNPAWIARTLSEGYVGPKVNFRSGIPFFEVHASRFMLASFDAEGALVDSNDGAVVAESTISFLNRLIEDPAFYDVRSHLSGL